MFEIGLVIWTFLGVCIDGANLLHAIRDRRLVVSRQINGGRRFAAADEIRRALLRFFGTQVVLFSIAVITFIWVPAPDGPTAPSRIAIGLLFLILPVTQSTQAILDYLSRIKLQRFYKGKERRSGHDRRRRVDATPLDEPHDHDHA